mgnify:CR=1 FL=1
MSQIDRSLAEAARAWPFEEARKLVARIGKIARDQHIPALNANPRFELAACASRNATVSGVPSFTDLDSMLAAVPGLHCISICTPPQAHFDAALIALRAD